MRTRIYLKACISFLIAISTFSNDTVFLLHITGHQDDPNVELVVDYRKLDNPYGVPPYAVQPRDSMDTNDARILDAFEHNGTIQWVSNSMDFSTGRSGVYHGFIHLPQLQNVGTGKSNWTPDGLPGLSGDCVDWK
jgi:hypothetical protein